MQMVEELHPGGTLEVKGKLAVAFMTSMLCKHWQARHMEDLRERADALTVGDDDDNDDDDDDVDGDVDGNVDVMLGGGRGGAAGLRRRGWLLLLFLLRLCGALLCDCWPSISSFLLVSFRHCLFRRGDGDRLSGLSMGVRA